MPTSTPIRDSAVVMFRESPLRHVANLFRPSPKTLLSPLLDITMAGGASIIFFFILNFFTKDWSSTTFNTWAIAMYYAAFLVNYPHFMSSYQLLYRDGRKGFFAMKSDPRLSLKLWWAGLIVPALLFGYFFFALSSENKVGMGYLVNAMYFFVGWHYVKQIYGCTIVLSSAKKVYYNALERWSVLVTLYALWAVSFISSNLNGGVLVFYQISARSFQIPLSYFYGAVWVLGIAALIMLALLIYKYIRSLEHPPLSAFFALSSIFLWFFPFYIWFPGFGSQYFFYIIPFFHSLQYLLFVLAYKRNWSVASTREREAELSHEQPVETPAQLTRLTQWGGAQFIFLPMLVIGIIMYMGYSSTLETLLYKWFGSMPLSTDALWVKTCLILTLIAIILVLGWKWATKSMYGKFNFFFLSASLLGLFLFTLVPNALDLLARNHLLPTFLAYDSAIFGNSLYLFFFLIFINIHHYFIDNVIWRKDNPHIREYLFTRP